MVIFGAANLVILLVVMAFKRYAFTSLWCAYAAVASVIILAYFWRTSKHPAADLRVAFVDVIASGAAGAFGAATSRAVAARSGLEFRNSSRRNPSGSPL